MTPGVDVQLYELHEYVTPALLDAVGRDELVRLVERDWRAAVDTNGYTPLDGATTKLSPMWWHERDDDEGGEQRLLLGYGSGPADYVALRVSGAVVPQRAAE